MDPGLLTMAGDVIPLMPVFDGIATAAFAIILIALLLFLINSLAYVYGRHRQRNNSLSAAFPSKRPPNKSLIGLAISLVIFFAACSASVSIGRLEVLRWLNSLSDNYIISVNSQSVKNQKDTLHALKSLSWNWGHHSHPTTTINLKISDGSQEILLTLARDSINPREYWVFFPQYSITRRNEIGRIITRVFDSY
jgi:cbb3-type cytochrome oxidase subunit 3